MSSISVPSAIPRRPSLRRAKRPVSIRLRSVREAVPMRVFGMAGGVLPNVLRV